MGPTEQEYRQALAWIEQLRTRVTQLEAANGDLLRQLDDLRRGVGVAVVIQGRAIPLVGPLSGVGAHQTGAPVAFPVPVSQPFTTPYSPATGPISASYPSAYPHSTPLSSPLGGRAQTDRTPAVPDENAWLTGQIPAVRPPSAGTAGPRGGAQRRQTLPSQRVTPEWLREETQGGQQQPTQHGPAARGARQTPAVTPYVPASNARPRPRGGVQARPLGGQESSERLPSLAELTGHVPAVRGRPKLSKRERDEYDDSFVLG